MLKTQARPILNGEVHDWYRIILGYEEKLVATLLDEFNLKSGSTVIDPFCGAGTTLVECMKRGLDCIGVDANPSSVFASKVKTDWSLQSFRISSLADQVQQALHRYLRRTSSYQSDKTFIYLQESGMLDRGWISEEPLRKSIAIKQAISDLPTSKKYKNALMLCLVSEVLYGASNMKFGPEIYRSTIKLDFSVTAGFMKRAYSMADDLVAVTSLSKGNATVLLGDSRNCRPSLFPDGIKKISAVICSPPYPTEHDYTRNARLELAFLEYVTDRSSVRSIKQGMIRSHTKGIYITDDDSSFVKDHAQIPSLVSRVSKKARTKTHGFAALYGKVVEEYFGGMKRHLTSIYGRLRSGAPCAYVVGDQASYLQVHIPTADILSTIAAEVGYEVVEKRLWRNRRSTTPRSKSLAEHILILRKP